ncbi:ATP phosphoribosyltransferase [Thermogymnomonas acidicola]|uniref:ATP phosphoribosyltransferase n=1 Tax=Thermogymnomonas acidicola TaxID=399579 RepID=A0AA37BRR9_9ARCH|nr:ATP phosphoribosyltransferase [Thermogymnomonas acidicola]GGM75877.1 ATP phosphoribosyltransferase [Thermogymnomonas acidicola]
MIFVIPKGRLMGPSLQVLRLSGVEVPDTAGRSLALRSGGNTFLISRAADVPGYVEAGAEIGITGSDVVEESGNDVLVPLDLPFGRCRLSIAAPPGFRGLRDGVRIASRYTNIASRLLSSRRVSGSVLKLSGSVELAAVTGMADAILDIVETGRTLEQNGLLEYEKVMDVRAQVVVNRVSWKTKYREMRALISRMEAACNGGY